MKSADNTFDKHRQYVTEQHKLGTGEALSLINFESDSPVIVINGDALTDIDFCP